MVVLELLISGDSYPLFAYFQKTELKNKYTDNHCYLTKYDILL